LYPKLRPRPNGPSREDVAVNQRTRLCGAMIEAVASRGYAHTSVAELCRLAGVSKRTFYEQFDNKDACFLATHDNVMACATARIVFAQRSAQDWEAGVRESMQALALAVAERPNAARLVLLEAPTVGPAALLHRDCARLALERTIATSFEGHPQEVNLPPLLAKGIVCGVERVMRRWLLSGRGQEPASVAKQLAEWILSYLSPALGTLGATAPAAAERRGVCPAPAQTRPGSERARILQAAGEIVAREGYARLTVARIARRAGISEEAFRASYESPEKCFLEVLDRMGVEALMSAAQAARIAHDGPPGVLRAVVALIEHVAGDPVLRRVAFHELLTAGAHALEHGERVLQAFTDLLVDGLPTPSRLSPVQADATIGALWGALHHHVLRGASHNMAPALTDQTLYLALAPLVGAEAAIEMIRVLRAEDNARLLAAL
jgi:AcrR family transcriptional regulator